MITSYEKYVAAVEKCSELAQAEAWDFLNSLDLSNKKASRDALLEEIPRIVDKWGAVAATAAAEYYEQERYRQIGGTYRAKVYPMGEKNREELLESIRYACRFLFENEEDEDE